MRNIRLEIEYDGRSYCGWQVQRREHKKSIQGAIEKALCRILGEKAHLSGSGRTDAGAHAQAQIANFKTTSKIPLRKLRASLNGLLPEDIAVTKVKEAHPDFHSRFSAKAKLYRYSILNRASYSPLLRSRVYWYRAPLNIELMRKEAKVLLGRHNFKSFQASDKAERDPVKTIKKIRISKYKGLIHIDIEADGFLYNMVRNIAGTLFEVGRGRFSEGSLEKILRAQDRRLAGPTLPAYGLCLMKVMY